MKPHFTALAAACALFTVSGCSADDEPQAATSSRPSAAATSTSSFSAPTASPTPTLVASTSPPLPTQPKLGQKQETDLGDITVYSVKFPVQPQDDVAGRIRTKGMQFAVADIKVCSNGTVNADGYGFDVSDFELIDTQSRAYTFWNVQVGARSPNLTDTVSSVDRPRKGACKRGWLTFELPPRTRIESVEYSPYDGTPLVWAVR